MSDVKKETSSPTAKVMTVAELAEKNRKDQSWKKEPWIGEDGFEYRRQRVDNGDGTFKSIDVRIGRKPKIEPVK